MTRPPSRALFSLLGLLLGALPLASCAELPEGPFRVDVRLSPTPPLVGRARVIVAVRDSIGNPVEGASVSLIAHRGDGSARSQAEATDEGGGSYVAEALAFEAAGMWTIAARVVTPDGRQGTVTQEIRVSGPR